VLFLPLNSTKGISMTTAQEIQELKTRLAELEEKVNQEGGERPQIIYGKQEGNHRRYIIKQRASNGGFYYDSVIESPNEPWKYSFRTKQDAEDWADALNVMMECRKFAKAFERGGINWYISYEQSEGLMIYRTNYIPGFCALMGAFPSNESAQKAVDAVGKDRIIRATKTLACVRD